MTVNSKFGIMTGMNKIIYVALFLIMLCGCNASDVSTRESEIDKVRILFNNAKYDEARHLCEDILADDPYNQEAIQYVKKIYDRKRSNYPNSRLIDASHWSKRNPKPIDRIELLER